MQGDLRRIFRTKRIICEFDLIFRIEIPVFFRSIERQMGPVETDCQKVRILILRRVLNPSDRLLRNQSVGIGFIRHICTLEGRTIPSVPLQNRLIFGKLVFVLAHLGEPWRQAPAVQIVVLVVIYFPQRLSHIPVLFEIFWQRQAAGSIAVHTRLLFINNKPGMRGPQTAQQAGTRRAAHSILTIRPPKDRALIRQPIQMGCDHPALPESLQLGPQIIHRNKQNIRPFFRRLGGKNTHGCRDDQTLIQYFHDLPRFLSGNAGGGEFGAELFRPPGIRIVHPFDHRTVLLQPLALAVNVAMAEMRGGDNEITRRTHRRRRSGWFIVGHGLRCRRCVRRICGRRVFRKTAHSILKASGSFHGHWLRLVTSRSSMWPSRKAKLHFPR